MLPVDQLVTTLVPLRSGPDRVVSWITGLVLASIAATQVLEGLRLCFA